MKNCTLQEIQPPCTTNHFRRFVAVRQVVLERGLFGDLDIVGLYAERFTAGRLIVRRKDGLTGRCKHQKTEGQFCSCHV